MQIETLATSDLVPYARNSRTHSEAQVAQIAASIREFGFTNPVLIDSAGGLIAGHGRVMAARTLGMAEVPCIRLGHLTDTQKRAYIIADNKLALNAGWDEAMLALEFRDLLAEGYDVGLTGYALPEIDELVAGLDATPEGNTDPDAAPPVEAVAVSRLGDVWLLGNHRIMCGDSTSAEHVAVLMDGKKAMLMQTDPPYGIAYVQNAKSKGQGGGHADIENDDLDGEKLQAFLEAMIRAALPWLNDNAAYYLWHPMLTQGTFFAAAAAGILVHRQLIWQKPSLVFGRGDYHWQHELCFYGWRQGHRPPFYGPRNQTTLWAVGRETSKDHPTAKPVALWLPPIDNHTRAGEAVYEPFSGSGSQIIAAEQTARLCYAMELSPNYVDVAIRRWQQFTGKTAVHAVTGAAFPG
jgi:DNA modification methylase